MAQIEVVLAGPNAGKTGEYGGIEFRDGVALVPARADGALNLLALYHNAYPRGSGALREAEEEWARTGQRATAGAEASRAEAAPGGRGDVERLRASLEQARVDMEEERASLEQELARTRAELRTTREAQRTAEAKLAESAKAQEAKPAATPPAPQEEPPKGEKGGRAKAKAHGE